jgi:hypothetical protein
LGHQSGWKSKIQTRQQQREPSMAHSEVLVSARKSRGADRWGGAIPLGALKLAGQSAEMLRYSPEVFNDSGFRLSFAFSLLQMM